MTKLHVFLILLLAVVCIVTLRACSKPEDPVEEVQVTIEDISECNSEEITDYTPSVEDVSLLARLIYAEAGSIESTMEKAAVAWCALNRVETPGFPNTLQEVIEQEGQFIAYSKHTPVTGENKCIATDVLKRYYLESQGEESVGRVLPKTYVYYRGNGVHNYFTEDFLGWEVWMFDCENPYE